MWEDKTEVRVELLHRLLIDGKIVYSLSSDGSTLYFLVDYPLSLFCDYELHQLDPTTKHHQIFPHPTKNPFKCCYTMTSSQGSLYFLDEHKKSHVWQYSLPPPSDMLPYLSHDFRFPLPSVMGMDQEGAVIVYCPGSTELLKLSGQGSWTAHLEVSGFCLDGEGNVVVVCGSKVRRVRKDFVQVEEIGGYSEGYLDGPLAVAQFSDLRGVCCDEYGNIYVVDHTTPRGCPKIRRIADGCVRTMEFEYGEEFSLEEYNLITGVMVVGGYLVGVWNREMIFRVRLGEEIKNWPRSHHKFEKKQQEGVQEVCLILRTHQIPRDLSVYCVKTLLWMKKYKFDKGSM